METKVTYCSLPTKYTLSNAQRLTASWQNLVFKKALLWDVALCRSWVKRRFGCRVQPSAHAGSSPADFSTLKMEAICSSETWVHTRYTQRHIPEDGILYRHRCGKLKSYMFNPVFLWLWWALNSITTFNSYFLVICINICHSIMLQDHKMPSHFIGRLFAYSSGRFSTSYIKV
jgi:hypothetical protein